ncbi:MAG: hypothetical protein VX527_02210 [Planctomycetota bacterium]|nr:hypothetical protein [Planctomycetota bacterium]
MGLISGFIQASAALAAEATQFAGRSRNRHRALQDESTTGQEPLERSVDGVELSDAVHSLPENASEESRQEHQRRQHDGKPLGVRKVDLTA